MVTAATDHFFAGCRRRRRHGPGVIALQGVLFAGLILKGLLVLGVSEAHAQAGLGWDDERPRADLATAGVTTTPASEGDLQVETALVNRIGAGYILDTPILARYGFLEDFEARLTVNLFSVVEDQEAEFGQYIGLGAKWRFYTQDMLALAFVPEFEIPVEESDGSLQVPLIAALDLQFTDMFGLSVNGGPVLSDNIGGRINVGLGAEVVEDVLVSLEFNAISNEVRRNEYETALNLWGTWWIDDRWTASAGLLKSLGTVDEWGFVVGIGGRFGLGTPDW